MRNYLLFVDTETSGIPHTLDKSFTETEHWPFVLQVAWRIYDPTGRLVKTENRFICEADITYEKASEKIHGITKAILSEKGESRKSVMRLFAKDLRHYKPLIIGHFVEFDSKMLQVAMHRSGIKNNVTDYPHFCTMLATSEYTRLTNQGSPKLDELYHRLFGEKMKRLHDASADAEATARCFFELLQKGEINDELISRQNLSIKVKKKARQKTGCGLPMLFFTILGLIWLFL